MVTASHGAHASGESCSPTNLWPGESRRPKVSRRHGSTQKPMFTVEWMTRLFFSRCVFQFTNSMINSPTPQNSCICFDPYIHGIQPIALSSRTLQDPPLQSTQPALSVCVGLLSCGKAKEGVSIGGLAFGVVLHESTVFPWSFGVSLHPVGGVHSPRKKPALENVRRGSGGELRPQCGTSQTCSDIFIFIFLCHPPRMAPSPRRWAVAPDGP